MSRHLAVLLAGVALCVGDIQAAGTQCLQVRITSIQEGLVYADLQNTCAAAIAVVGIAMVGGGPDYPAALDFSANVGWPRLSRAQQIGYLRPGHNRDLALSAPPWGAPAEIRVLAIVFANGKRLGGPSVADFTVREWPKRLYALRLIHREWTPFCSGPPVADPPPLKAETNEGSSEQPQERHLFALLEEGMRKELVAKLITPATYQQRMCSYLTVRLHAMETFVANTAPPR